MMGLGAWWKKFRKKAPPLERHEALSARPFRLPVIRQEVRGEKLYVTVRFERPRWQRALGAERFAERQFGLDPYGREVYALCDGEASVVELGERFARAHRISLPEAELAVSSFIRTLMGRGIVALRMAREGEHG